MAVVCHYYYGSIPAWAGETDRDPQAKPLIGVYPRVGGGNIAAFGIGAPGRGLSPRGRGKRG